MVSRWVVVWESREDFKVYNLGTMGVFVILSVEIVSGRCTK